MKIDIISICENYKFWHDCVGFFDGKYFAHLNVDFEMKYENDGIYVSDNFINNNIRNLVINKYGKNSYVTNFFPYSDNKINIIYMWSEKYRGYDSRFYVPKLNNLITYDEYLIKGILE